MTKRLWELVAEHLAAEEIIAPEERELYIYSVGQLAFTALNLLTAAALGWQFHMMWEALLFLLAYSLLRSYAGGYHASTQLRCYLSSTLLFALALKGIELLQGHGWWAAAGIAAGAVFIWITGPLADDNKPLDEAERRVYRRRMRIILVLELFIYGVLALCGAQAAAACVSAAVCLTGALMLFFRLQRAAGSGMSQENK